jgi:DNA gyrase subunit A
MQTGRGSVIMRGRVDIEPMRKRPRAIIVTEIPYPGEQGDDDREDGRTGARQAHRGHFRLRDESDRQGYRVVIELKRDANAEVILNQLYRYTPLQTSFGCNMVALNGGKPELMTLKDMLRAFVSFREEVVSRRTKFLLRKARDRAHVLVGLAIAVANIDEVIKPDPHRPIRRRHASS